MDQQNSLRDLVSHIALMSAAALAFSPTFSGRAVGFESVLTGVSACFENGIALKPKKAVKEMVVIHMLLNSLAARFVNMMPAPLGSGTHVAFSG